jgi:nucleotide-binding universal stress UspA family protein
MYGTILWATDASDAADGALEEARSLLDAGGRLLAFHCDERFVGARSGGGPLLVDEIDRRAKLHAQTLELRERGIDAELIVKTTHVSAAREIAKAAELHEADAIVCGTCAWSALSGALSRSVAMRLPHLAPCPVVIVSEHAAKRAARAAG